MNTFSKLSAAALALALAVPALSAALPQPKTEHGVTYLSGGIGEDESAAMKAEAKNYPLSVVFSAGKYGEYLAHVPVKITDRSGKVVLDTVSKGPILLVRLAPGRYTVTATRDGKTLRQAVEVKAKGDTPVAMHWAQA